MRHHHHGPSRWRGRWRGPGKRGWLLARGIHRRLVAFLFLAVAMGLYAGWILRDASGTPSTLMVLGGLALLMWPLAWAAMLRIARPVWELAEVASELREGRLSSRDKLTEGDDEVGEVAGALHAMAGRVSDQLATQRALLAAVSHELRSPLARMRVMVELSREGQATEALHDDLQAEVDGMDALVADLLAASRIDFEALTPVALEARDVAARALEMARFPAEVLQIDPSAGTLHADATLAARAVSVLLDNARRHGGPTIALRVFGTHDTVTFEVHDDGPGFEPGVEEQIFEPFWRPAGTPRTGVGLGLALVRQIAHAHEGTAGAATRPSGGARVWIVLPR